MFKSIEAINFISWKHLHFEIPEGVTLIEGFNHDDSRSEGSGKSSIPNALAWGLFGRTPKPIRVDDVIFHNEKSCRVTITLSDGTQIERSRNPNRVRIINPSGSESEGTDSRATQELIDNLIGFNFETFCQCVYFAQNHIARFVSCTPEQKSEILGKIINSEVYDSARLRTKQRISILELELNKFVTQDKSDKRALDLVIDSIKHFGDYVLISTRERLIALSSQITELEVRMLSIKPNNFDLETDKSRLLLKSRLDSLNKEKNEVSAELISIGQKRRLKANIESELKELVEEGRQLKEKIEKLRSAKSICPLCKSQLKDNSHIMEEIVNLEANLSKKRNRRDHLVAQLESIKVTDAQNLHESLESLEKSIRTCSQEYEDHVRGQEELKAQMKLAERDKQQLAQLQTQLDKGKQELVSIEALVETKKIEKSKLESDLAASAIKQGEFQTKINKLGILRDAFKEIKAYSFQNILENLSIRANGFAQELFEVPIELRFTNLSETGEISKIELSIIYDGEERSLGLLSGGQFRRVQLAVDLALSDIIDLNNEQPVKLLILDEAFKDLSFTSQEKFLKLLSQLNKSILLIEHNELFKQIVTQSFRIELRDGVSSEAP